MALVCDKYWLNWPIGKGAGRNGRAEKLWRVGKSEKVGLRHDRNSLRERKSALQGWKGIDLMTVVKWCVSGAKDLRFIGREFHNRGGVAE